MPYDARVFQVLIASPGDVQEERDLLAEVINEWNYVNSRDRRVVLLPLRWETHSVPEMGARAQAIINKQVVDHCDMAVGVFWTRVGTPTGGAESGTAEEIARVGDAGKPVMLYFSKSKVDLDLVDLDEYKRLRDFRSKTYPQGLIETYVSLSDFREKFARQLALKMLDVVAEDSAEQSRSGSTPLVALSLAEGNPPYILPDDAVLELTRMGCSNVVEIPDFAGNEDDQTPNSDGLRIGVSLIRNPDFYREVVSYYCQPQSYGPLRFAITGLADQGVRDLYLEIRISGLAGEIKFEPDPALPEPVAWKPSPSRESAGITIGSASIFNSGVTFYGDSAMYNAFRLPPAQFELKRGADNEPRMEIAIPVVQAQRTVFSTNAFWLAIERDCTVVFDATVYSSDSTPFSSQTQVDVRLKRSVMTYAEIIEQFSRVGNDRLGRKTE